MPVEDHSSLRLSRTPAFAAFNKMTRQDNHLLITILVGLDCVASGEATLSDTFPTSWAPKDPKSSAARGRTFALQTFLAWLAGAVDAYLLGVAHLPDRVFRGESPRLTAGLNGAGVEELAHVLRLAAGPELPLTLLALAWRNRLAHNGRGEDVDAWVLDALIRHAEELQKDYQGLDAHTMLERWMVRSAIPSLKEVTAMSRAAHCLIGAIEGAIVSRIDHTQYLHHIIETLFRDAPSASQQATTLWGRTPDRNCQSLKRIAATAGMVLADGLSGVTTEELYELGALSPQEGLRRFAHRETTTEHVRAAAGQTPGDAQGQIPVDPEHDRHLDTLEGDQLRKGKAEVVDQGSASGGRR